jgi:hypothetical protein
MYHASSVCQAVNNSTCFIARLFSPACRLMQAALAYAADSIRVVPYT